jgi:hypothetical protein
MESIRASIACATHIDTLGRRRVAGVPLVSDVVAYVGQSYVVRVRVEDDDPKGCLGE